MNNRTTISVILITLAAGTAVGLAQQAVPPAAVEGRRSVAGVVANSKGEVVVGAIVSAEVSGQHAATTTGSAGDFTLFVPSGFEVRLRIEGPYMVPLERTLGPSEEAGHLQLTVRYVIGTVRNELVITAAADDPAIDRRNDTVYKNTLFLRDDQLFETLSSGINAGQHEGGGKSLEFRRYGFNLDHGGLNGGLKVLVDDIPQNQATQAHGQGYLGWLKELSPELINDVDILNGPFSPEYGDFSALGVVHVRLKERLENAWTVRAQGGSFDGYRTVVAWSPRLQNVDSFLSWEHAYTDGPFKNPLHYTRDNFTGNYTFKLTSRQSLGFKGNGGRNDFDSSGQIPLDLVQSGQLDRFGHIDPSDGGRVRMGTGSLYYKNDLSPSDTLRVDGYVIRSLFDLFSDFTFFLDDPVHGDGIQQHDSRLQEGASSQYVHTGRLWGHPALFIAGANLFDSWINVDLFHDQDRQVIPPQPGKPWTEDNVHITNAALYLQEGIDFPRLHVDAGLRYDQFRFNLVDRLVAANSGLNYAGNAEPKVNIVYTPSQRIPFAIHWNYGQGISSQDARGIALAPAAPKVATTSFYMLGTSHQLKRFSLSTDLFLIDRQHENVYDPDNGTMQFQGPSRSYGWEAKTSVQLSHHLSWNGDITQVSNAFFLGTAPRQYVSSAPHTVANTSLTLSGWHGLFSSVRYRHTGHYIVVDGDSIAPKPPPYAIGRGLDVVDFALTKKLSHGLEWNLSIDNLNNKQYFETQNYFTSQVCASAATCPYVGPASNPGFYYEPNLRMHGTPGYPIGFTTGFTWRSE